MLYGSPHGCHVSTPIQSLCPDRRCWSHQDAVMCPGIYFTAGFGKCTSLLDVNASRPHGATQQNFVLHKGLDFGKTSSLDFPASEPADPAHSNFQFVVFKKEEGWASPRLQGTMLSPVGTARLRGTQLLPCCSRKAPGPKGCPYKWNRIWQQKERRFPLMMWVYLFWSVLHRTEPKLLKAFGPRQVSTSLHSHQIGLDVSRGF